MVDLLMLPRARRRSGSCIYFSAEGRGEKEAVLENLWKDLLEKTPGKKTGKPTDFPSNLG